MSMNMFDFATYFDFTRINDADYLKEKFIKKYQKNNYAVLKYDKNALNVSNIDSLGKFRSVIYNTDTEKIVTCAPFKAHSYDNFMSKAKDNETNISFEEYCEGTMINMFYDNGEWQIATRSIIGGKGVFFKGGKTFRQMFLECMNECDVDFDDFHKGYSYSFVIQHNDNRIVTNFPTPNLVLCAVYKINGTLVEEMRVIKETFRIMEKVKTPRLYEFDSIDKAKDELANALKTPYYIQGVILKYNGMRTKIRNPNYEYVRQLRGNQPKSQFQYLSLRNQGRVSEFLKYYPEYASEFDAYRTQVHTFTKNLHHNYIQCYVKKMMPLGQFPREYRQHMYILHQKYIKDLIPQGKYISYEFVVNYVNSMKPAHLMYAINYKHRQQVLDDSKEIKKEELEKVVHEKEE